MLMDAASVGCDLLGRRGVGTPVWPRPRAALLYARHVGPSKTSWEWTRLEPGHMRWYLNGAWLSKPAFKPSVTVWRGKALSAGVGSTGAWAPTSGSGASRRLGQVPGRGVGAQRFAEAARAPDSKQQRLRRWLQSRSSSGAKPNAGPTETVRNAWEPWHYEARLPTRRPDDRAPWRWEGDDESCRPRRQSPWKGPGA